MSVPDARPPTVVLLHGLARSHRSVDRLRCRIEAAGYPAWARSYPSRKLPLAGLAQHLAAQLRAELPATPLIAVTHSLGGVLVRLLRDALPWRGAVLVAPPNQGSRVAARLARGPLLRWTHGPAGPELAGGASWPPPPEPFAVIAGTRSLTLSNPTSWLTRSARLLPRGVPSDGTVAVEETRLAGMADFATVDACHTWIMDHPRTAELVLAFLARGRFDEGASGG